MRARGGSISLYTNVQQRTTKMHLYDVLKKHEMKIAQ